jgi:hypothetical protein
VIGITDRSAVITWTTDEAADSGVDYGLNTGFGASELDPAFLTSHSVALAGLTASTTYHFRARSSDRAGNPPAYSGNFAFITAAAPDTTAPELSNVRVSGITDRLAVVSWTTNEPADSAVEYGRDAGFGVNLTDKLIFVLRHSLILKGLAASTKYYFQVASTDPSGNGPSRSATYSFTTLGAPDVLPPVISNIRVSGITDRLAIVTWETDEPADGTVQFGTDASYGRAANHDGLLTLHELTLAGLAAQTTCHFRILCTDATGNGPSVSEDLNFTTSATPDTVAPSISNLAVEGIAATGAVVTWETDEPADATVDYGATTGYGLTATVLEYSLLHTLPIQGLAPDTAYHLRASSSDPSGNTANSPDIVFRTAKGPALPDTTAPVMSLVEVSGVTDTRAVVIWTTDEPADSEVHYGQTTGYGLTMTEPAYVFIHSLVLEGLTPSTTYRALAMSRDVIGNGPSAGNDVVFTTAAGPDLTAPVISAVRITNITNQSVVISWETSDPANSIVESGASASYGRNITSRLFVLNHSVVLTGLSPSTTYHFRVGGSDPSSNAANFSADQAFTTLGTDTGPGHRPVPTKTSEFPWAWAFIVIALVALLAGMLVLGRSIARQVRRQPATRPEPAATPGAAFSRGPAKPATEELVETIAMDEDIPLVPATAYAAAPAGPAASARTPIVDWGTPATIRAPIGRIRCPACKTTVALYHDGPQQIICPACGTAGMYKGRGN